MFQVGDKQIKASAGDKGRMIFGYNPAGKIENTLGEAAAKFMPHDLQGMAKACAYLTTCKNKSLRVRANLALMPLGNTIRLSTERYSCT